MPISKNELKTSFTGTRKISKKNSKKNSKKTSKKNKSKINTSTEEMMDILNSDNHTNQMQPQMQNPQMQQQMQMYKTYNENVDPLMVNQFVSTNEQGQIINSNNRFEQLLGLAQLNPNYNNNNNLSTEMSMQSLNPMGAQLANQLNMQQMSMQQMSMEQQQTPHMGMENQNNLQLENIRNLAALQNIPKLV